MYGKNAAFAALSSELFNVAPSVPTVGRTSAAVMNMPSIGLAPGTVPPPHPTVTSPGPSATVGSNIPIVPQKLDLPAAPPVGTAKPSTAASPPMPAGVGQPAQQPVKVPTKAPLGEWKALPLNIY